MDILDVELFSMGEWNGDPFTEQDLHDMVCAYQDNALGFPPVLKLGHDKNQKVLKELIPNSGMPAAGYVSRMYVAGGKLLADFTDVPEKLYDLIKKKAYRKVSIELFTNAKIGEKVYKRLIGAVALMGAENPGVMNLSDILSCYSKITAKEDQLKVFSNGVEINTELEDSERKDIPMPKSEQEIKLEAELALKQKDFEAQKQKLTDTEKSDAEKAKKLADAETKLKEFEAREAKNILEKEEQRVDTFVTSLVTEKLCTPAMKPIVKDILSDKKEFALKDKKVSKEELLKEAFVLFKAAAEVNFEENSSTGDAKDKNDKLKEVESKAMEYSKKHDVTFSAALKVISKEMNVKI